jgi:aminodeoxyfutalosine synthase
MLFGHIESRKDRIDHMNRLRELQDKTGGFNAFIPLVYQRENNFLKVEKFLSANEILKQFKRYNCYNAKYQKNTRQKKWNSNQSKIQ